MRLIGVDGCRGGWLAAVSDELLSAIQFVVFERFAPLVEFAESTETTLVIDIPIGLTEKGPRQCDLEARKILGRGNTSRVFPAPCRAALAGESYLEACDLSEGADSGRLSRQLFAILGKIREVDSAMSAKRQTWLREGHPEVTFALLSAHRQGIDERKKTREGESQRLNLLAAPGVTPDIGAVRNQIGSYRVSRDDIVDAAACLVSARRLYRGEAGIIPSGVIETDSRGLRMEMVA